MIIIDESAEIFTTSPFLGINSNAKIISTPYGLTKINKFYLELIQTSRIFKIKIISNTKKKNVRKKN